MYTIDFETHKVVNGSDISPIPVGVSIKHNGEPSHYYAWGHPTKNNCKYTDAKIALEAAYASGEEILCHNAKFDLRIIAEYFGLPVPEPRRIHDTMIMAYLIDAREPSLGLKDLAFKYCGMPPDDQARLRDWILANVSGAKQSNWGEYIAYAPGDLVGHYAESDTDMTFVLFHAISHQILNLTPEPPKQTNSDAYAREQAILPIVIDLEQRGITVSPDIAKVRSELEAKFDLIELQLKAYGDNQEPGKKAFFDVLRRKGLIDEKKIQYTEKGNPRYGKEFLDSMIKDKNLTKLLITRSKLQKFLGTYLRPFAESAEKYNGKFFPYYNQTRSEDDYGTRTGRFSSNIQQLPKDSGANTDSYDGSGKVEELPSIRSQIVAAPGKILIKRDFSGQELRVTAHYAEGKILKAYQDNPRMDVHSFVDNLIIEMTGKHLSRTPVKMISFLKLYGGGPKQLALRLGMPIEQAYEFFNAYDTALPEFKELMKDIEKLSRSGKKIRTWGGRSYDVEPAKDGRDFYYKLGNILIQGSSADMTKEAMIRYHYHPDRVGDILMQVHDELVIEVDENVWQQEMELLRWAMDEIPGWDCPLRSDGKYGYNLAEMQEYEDVE